MANRNMPSMPGEDQEAEGGKDQGPMHERDTSETDEGSFEQRIGQLQRNMELRDKQENALIETLLSSATKESDIQILWLDLLATREKVESETRELIKAKLRI